jgi:hypothetical protein
MQKLKAERSFCALGLYAGPPFCRAWLFYFSFSIVILSLSKDLFG